MTHHPPPSVCLVMSKCRWWRTGNENIPFVQKLTSRALNYFHIREEPRASADVSSSCGNEKLNVADFTDPPKTSMIYKARTRANDSLPPSESSSFSLNSISDISLTFPATNYKSGRGSGGFNPTQSASQAVNQRRNKTCSESKSSRWTGSEQQCGGRLQMNLRGYTWG